MTTSKNCRNEKVTMQAKADCKKRSKAIKKSVQQHQDNMKRIDVLEGEIYIVHPGCVHGCRPNHTSKDRTTVYFRLVAGGRRRQPTATQASEGKEGTVPKHFTAVNLQPFVMCPLLEELMVKQALTAGVNNAV